MFASSLAAFVVLTPARAGSLAPPWGGPTLAEEARAMAFVTEGNEHLELEAYTEAAAAFEAAYGLTHRIDVLPKLAAAYEGLGDRAHAVEIWTEYREHAPIDARGAVDVKIATLRAIAPAPVVVPPRVDPTPWVVACLGGGLAATGLAVAVAGPEPAWDRAHPLDTVGTTSIVAGVTLGTTGLVWGTLREALRRAPAGAPQL